MIKGVYIGRVCGHIGQIWKITKKILNRVLQAQEVAPGGRGDLGITNSPPGGSVHWGVVGGCDSGPKEGVF